MIRSCLKLSPRQQGAKEFQERNWVTTTEKLEQSVATKVFKH